MGSFKKTLGQVLPLIGAAVGLAFPALAPIIVGGAGLLGAYLAYDSMATGDWGAQANDADLIQSNFKSTQKTIPIVYGKRRVGSNDVFMEMSGVGEDRVMWIVSCLSEGVCEGIAIDPDTGEEQIYLDTITVEEFNRKHREKNGVEDIVKYYFHNGSPTQTVDTNINAAIPRFTDSMRNTCYVVWEIKWVKGLFAGLPTRQVVINGVKVKDTRTGSTAFSDNPALHLYDFIANDRYGLGFDPSFIDTESFNDAATYCEGGTGWPAWKTNYVVASQIRSQTVIDTLLAHFRGNLSWYDGLLSVNYAELSEEQIVADISDSDIMRSPKGYDLVTVSQPSSFMAPDSALIKFISEHKNWTLDDVHVGDKRGNIVSYEFPGFTDRVLALNMGTYMLERAQLNRTYTFRLRASNIVLEPNDLVSVTSKEAALSSFTCRVIQSNIETDGSITTSLVAESDSMYNSFYDLEPTEVYSVNIADPSEAPPPVSSITFEEETYHYRSRSFVRLNVGFDAPTKTTEGLDYPWFDYAEVHVSYNGINFEFLFNAPSGFQIDPVGEGPIWIALVSVSSYGQAQSFETAMVAYHRVKGVSEIRPTSEPDFSVTVTGSTVVVYAPIRTDPDVAGYELRLGNDWYANNWYDASLLSLMTNPTISFTPVKPGQHYLWMDVKSKNGLYSGSPGYRTFYITRPPMGYTETDGATPLLPLEIDYNSGAHYGTKVVNISGSDALQVDRGLNNNQEGYFVSSVYDISSSSTAAGKPVLISIDCGTALVGGGNTWPYIAPTTATWPEIATPGQLTTWKDLASISDEPASIKIEVQVSSGGGDWETIYGLETVTGTVYNATYIRFIFRIADPQVGSFYTAGPAVLNRYVIAPKIKEIATEARALSSCLSILFTQYVP